MTVGGRGSLSPRSAPLSVGYCIYSRGALLSSHLPSPLLMGGGQLSWNHWMGRTWCGRRPTWCLGTPVRPRGWGDWGEVASFPWVCLEGCLPPREATASSEGDMMGPRPPALGTSCGGAGVAESSCHGRDLASRRRGPSLHSGLSCTKKERGLWARGQEPECCFWAGPSLRCSDGGRGGPELFGGSVSQARSP